ncbi:hypothetical protein O181_097949 [Austropuccinia psidii MF-1]|uniref:Calcineurin-like phosphoesterase domain-containing protein n=1 Tax=Austropuccinia psidii MF-1 TaxID=1389203 RepID=A0A9Q3JA96_9BASI|nr:hypothetical protein [Austropuccinia psidii MF-1]
MIQKFLDKLTTNSHQNIRPDPLDDDDAEFLLPNQSGQSHKKFQRVKHSISYLAITALISFTLLMMVWLGPGLVNHDPTGIASQSNAHIGYLQDSTQSNNPSNPSKSNQKPSKIAVTPIKPEQRPLPTHSWNPLLADRAPITHVQVKACMFPPWAFASLCSPTETAKEITLYGKWVRVPRDLSKGVGHYYTEIYYRRAQSLDLSSLKTKPITGLRVLDDSESQKPEIKSELEKFGWEPAGQNLRTGIWPKKVPAAKLWLTRSTNWNGTQEIKPITEIDVLWAKNDQVKPWWGFERIGKPVFDSTLQKTYLRCDVVVRRDIFELPHSPNLTFQPGGKFKILQISDLQFSASGGKCHSANLLPSCKEQGADNSTLIWLSDAIQQVKPDLIVLTGDQLLGGDLTFDTISTLAKFGRFFGDKMIPWTIVYGEDDEDKSLAKEEQMYMMKHMPYFVGKAGPGVPGFPEEGYPQVDELSDMGVGNYVIGVRAGVADPTQVLTLYFLDSHSYPPLTISQLWSLALGTSPTYDWLKDSQIAWYKNQSDSQPKLRRPYWPAYERFAHQTNQTEAIKKPPALMFFHIPLPEAYGPTDKNPKTGGELVFGNQIEGQLSSEKGDEFFKNAILQSNDGTSETEVKVIVNGHAHLTDTCRRHEGVWNCFSGVSSYGATAQDDWERRVRVFEVEDYGEKIKTYQLKDSRVVKTGENSKFGHVTLYDSSGSQK